MEQVIRMLQESGKITLKGSPESIDKKIFEITKGLTPEQLSVVYNYFVGPIRILAIPGSGKTHTMIVLAMKLWMLFPSALKSRPRVRMITFTRKAAQEARERLVAKVGGDAGRGVTTFHALAIQIYMNDKNSSKIWPEKCSMKSFSDSDQKKLIEKIIELRYSYSEVETKDVIDLWNFHTNNISDYGEFESIIYDADEDSMEGIICEIIGEVLDVMKSRSEIPMNLVIPIAVSLLKMRTMGVCEYIIVDEFQDTNNSQFEFSRQLVKPYDNIIVVGDTHQGIYRWRGAKPENLEEKFENEFPDLISYDLTLNFRSTRNILKAGSLVLPSYYEETFPHEPASNENGRPITIHRTEGPERECEVLVEWIKNMHKAYALPYHEIFVLFRSVSFVPYIEKNLVRNGIPYEVTRGAAFFSRKEVRNLLAYMKWSLSPRDFASARRVINWPRRKAGHRTVERISNFNYNKSNWPSKLMDFQHQMIFLNDKLSKGEMDCLEWVRFILFRIGLFEAHQKEDARESFSVIMDWMLDFRDEGLSPEEALNEMLATSELNRDNESDSRVKLMTIHGSKGLEAEAVFICHAVEGNIPSSGLADMQEECHLMYVAITRAKKHLFISCPQRIFKYGKIESTQPSRFLNEVIDGMKKGKEMELMSDSPRRGARANY